MIIEGQTLTGEQKPVLSGKERDQLASQWLPPYYQATRAGRTFYLSNQAQTMATTHNTPLAAATGTPIVGIINPVGNTKAAVITYGWFVSVSGTPAAQAHPVWNYATQIATVSTNPAGTISNGMIQFGSPSTMLAYNNVALTGMLISTGSVGAIRPFGMDTFAGAMAANGNNSSVDYVDGAIIVPPGAVVGLFAGVAAGTSWVVSAGMGWQEIDI